MREDGAFHFQAEGEVNLIYLCLIFSLIRISPRRNFCEIMAKRYASEPIPMP